MEDYTRCVSRFGDRVRSCVTWHLRNSDVSNRIARTTAFNHVGDTAHNDRHHAGVLVVERFVLTELTEYLERQWRALGGEVQNYVRVWVEKSAKTLLESSDHVGLGGYDEAPPHCKKALQRSGLHAEDSKDVVVPLVGIWIRTQGTSSKQD